MLQLDKDNSSSWFAVRLVLAMISDFRVRPVDTDDGKRYVVIRPKETIESLREAADEMNKLATEIERQL